MIHNIAINIAVSLPYIAAGIILLIISTKLVNKAIRDRKKPSKIHPQVMVFDRNKRKIA